MGLLAAAAPVVIHWLTRPRPRRLPLSTLRFVREAVEQRRSRARLRDWLVLALRTAAVLLIAAAMARPLFGRRDFETPPENAAVAKIVLLDASHSLAAVGHDMQLFERARSIAAKELDYQPGLAANLIVAGAQPKSLFAGLSSNFGALREELSNAAVLPETFHVTNALNAVAEQLSASPPGARRELVILSDFQRTSWASADFSVLPKDTVIRLESVAPDEPAFNLALLNVGVDGRIEVGRPVRLQVEVGNFSPQAHEVKVDLRFGRATPEGTGALYSSFQLTGMCQPFSRTTLTNDVVPTEPGWMAGEATLTAADGVIDALPADNIRACVWDVRPQPELALVTRQSPKQRPSSSYFLERALVPADVTGRTAKSIRRIDSTRFDVESVGAADLLILDHPGPLSEGSVNQLAGLLRRGKSLLYVAAETADATNLQRLSEAAGPAGALPVAFAPLPVSGKRDDVFIGDVRKEAAPFEIFGDQLPSLLRDLRIVPGLTSRPVDGALREDVLGSLSDGSAFLAATSAESGCLAVLNADLEASNLAASPMFVPLLLELMQRRMLAGRRSTTQVTCGEPALVLLPSEAAAITELRLSGPEQAGREPGSIAMEASGAVLRMPAVGRPGVYTVSHGEDVVFAVAGAVPAAESDLRTLSSDVFRDRLAGDRNVSFRSATGSDEESTDTLWSWLALGCVLCVVGELTVLKAFQL
jgi:hypothetical protein